MKGLNPTVFFLVGLGISWFSQVTQTAPSVGDIIQNLIFSTKCLKDLGCFYNGPPFYHPIWRPVSHLPFDLKDMKTKFWLYTPLNNRTLIEPNKKSLEKSGYDKDTGLYIFVHGFSMSIDEEMQRKLEVFLSRFQKIFGGNAIVVDWGASNKDPYPQAVANGRVVGAQIAQMVQFLQNEAGLDPKKVHIIGGSLGAQVAGWAGERIPDLGRITGLDPAGPYFRFGDRKTRLDKTDANFVDVIHTNAAMFFMKGLGIDEAIGDIDFYPNGGSAQPGCKHSLNISFAGIDAIIMHGNVETLVPLLCDHGRSVNYFIASMDNTKCKFIGTQCDNYAKYKSGQCQANKKVEMGFHAKKDSTIPPGSKFYLDTSENSPYCIKT